MHSSCTCTAQSAAGDDPVWLAVLTLSLITVRRIVVGRSSSMAAPTASQPVAVMPLIRLSSMVMKAPLRLTSSPPPRVASKMSGDPAAWLRRMRLLVRNREAGWAALSPWVAMPPPSASPPLSTGDGPPDVPTWVVITVLSLTVLSTTVAVP